MPVRHDAASATSKWVQNLSASTQAITQGVQRVTKSPGAAAAANKQGWVNGVNAAADKWARRVGAVSLSDWQDAMINVGVPRVAQGAQAKQGKFESFMSDFLPYLKSVTDKVDQMPRDTQEARIARAVAQMRGTAGYQRKA